MSVDKLVDSTQLDSDLTSVANAIRAKSGGSGQLAFPSGFVSEIGNIPSGGGGYTAADFFDPSKPEGRVEFTATTFNSNSNYFSGRSGITEVFGTNYNETNNRSNFMRDMANLKYAVLPKASKLYNYAFYNCPKLEAIDVFGGSFAGSSSYFNGDTNLKTIIIRKDSAITSLGGVNIFQNSPFGSGGSGGTIYIPKTLYDALDTGTNDYKAATNWSTIDGYGTITWAKIEGSYYETHYADGTLIPTE